MVEDILPWRCVVDSFSIFGNGKWVCHQIFLALNLQSGRNENLFGTGFNVDAIKTVVGIGDNQTAWKVNRVYSEDMFCMMLSTADIPLHKCAPAKIRSPNI